MLHLGPRLHAFLHGLFQRSDEAETREMYRHVKSLFEAREFGNEDGRSEFVAELTCQALERSDAHPDPETIARLADFAHAIFDNEDMFVLPDIDWTERRSISDWWEIKDHLAEQKALVADFATTRELVVDVLAHCHEIVAQAVPSSPRTRAAGDITVATTRLDRIADLGRVVESIGAAFFDDAIEKADLFKRHRKRLEANLIAASGGNPADPKGFSRQPKQPSKSDIRDRAELVDTYLGGTPLTELFAGEVDFTIPQTARFEHSHIVAGTGHGKTQTLQYLIANDLAAVEQGQASVVVIDSQGDLIRAISDLKQFAPGEPLHERVCIIDPSDVEYPVSLNLFDIGQARLDRYSQLDRERLTNSILELYDFVLGSLLSAEMTQKQNVIFRYVTRLMLHIPDATIHTLRELMEKDSEARFAEHIAKLSGTARHFFETEFASKEFEQTRRQVLRRLWGILENQTFERMFSHPRSKLDLFAEMNAGKVILINTAKDLLKETGTEILGRFFIALIAQAAQERAVLPANKRMPTFVYIDEAADYFDRNIGLILSQSRKYNIGMVLAHQYLGQLDPKLQDAFAANTSIKLSGGVSNKDAKALAPMLACEPALIEGQPKLSFATFVRGITKSALPLKFPYGHLEAMETMTKVERNALRTAMREKYAMHYSAVDATEERGASESEAADDDTDRDAGKARGRKPDDDDDPDNIDTNPSPQW